MELNADSLRYILGLKLRRLRQQQSLGLKDVAKATGMSVSYLSEIEKGRKYPKADKILQLASALDVPYEQLVSPQVSEELRPLRELFNSEFLQEFPFHLFGVEPEAVVGLVSEVPTRAGALLRAFLEIGRTYDVRVEHFLFAALRSFQQLHDNHFAEIETAADDMLKHHRWNGKRWLEAADLRQVLDSQYRYQIDEQTLHEDPQLDDLRSVWAAGERPRLWVNGRLLDCQKAFLYGRELGYLALGLTERSPTSSYLRVESFDQVINDFQAAYFSGALLIQRSVLLADLERFFARAKWSSKAFLDLVERYRTTPETFFYRLSQLLPNHYGWRRIFFVRFTSGSDRVRRIDLTKILNMTRLPIPLAIEPREHHCRRWPGVAVLAADGEASSAESAAIQLSRFETTGEECLVLTLARPLALASDRRSSVSLAIRLDADVRKVIRFASDPSLPRRDVGLTCERCGIAECAERAAPAERFAERHRRRQREDAFDRLVSRVED